MKKIVSLFFGLLLGAVAVSAQNVKVSGTVIAKEDGYPLPGVAVLVKGTHTGTQTDLDGVYEMSVPKGATLVFSYISYREEEIAVGNGGVFNVALETDALELEAVVAVGYGVMKKSDLTGSVASVKGDQLQKTPAAGLDQALQGVAAGVTVNASSGQPGAAAEVRIRGIGTVNNSAPIYVVDGVIVDNINYLSPSDIASTEILKDASATAIYGSRGANGVILVTTKKGGTDGKANITFDAYFGLQSRWKTIELMNADEFSATLASLTSATQLNYLQQNGRDQWVRQYLIGRGRSHWYPSNLDYSTVDTDWQDQVFRLAPIQNYHIGLDYGNDKGYWSMSASWFNQQGTVIGSDYSRLSLRVNSAYNVKPWLKVGENLSFMYSYGRSAMNNNAAPAASIISAAIAMAPWDPARYPAGAMNGYGEDMSGVIAASSNFKNVTNPLSMVEYSHPSDKTERWVGDIFLEITPIKGLVFRSDVSLDMTNVRHKLFKDAYQHSDYDKTDLNFLEESMSQYSTVIVENTLTWMHDFGKFNVNVMGGQTLEEYNYENIGGSGANILNPVSSNWYLSQTTENRTHAGDGAARSRRFSFLGRAHASYDGRYMATVNFRADGSSKFPEHPWGYFPSVALAWRMSKEPFMEGARGWLEDLKLRAGWGRIGNDKISDNAFLLTMFNSGPTFVDYPLGPAEQAYQSGATILTYVNNGGMWETTEQLNLGIDFGLWKNQLTGSVEVFQRDTRDMLLSVTAPANVGNRYSATANVGTVRNQGVEITLEHRGQRGAFHYDLNGNVSFIRNELTALNGGEKVWGDRTVSDEGLPLYTFWGYNYEGIYRTDAEAVEHLWGTEIDASGKPGGVGAGDARYKDRDGNGIIDDRDRTNLGNPFPWLTYGINASFGWRDWDANLFFQGVAGNEIYNALRLRTEGTGNTATLSPAMRDVWTTSNPGGSIPNPNGSAKNQYDSDRFIENGAYLRLKNVQIGYTIPAKITEKAGISRCRFYLQGSNLLTFTGYTGYDPEVGGGVDYGNYPQARTVMLGVNINF